MPGLAPGIHAVPTHEEKLVDGRDKPGHDEFNLCERMAREAMPLHHPRRYFGTATVR
jgi:hypothetical protein